jgi:tetratricopeptide (TPR) repeat protein
MSRKPREKPSQKPTMRPRSSEPKPAESPGVQNHPRIARREWVVLALILLLGLLLRGAYLLEQRDAPDFASPIADAMFHDYWARGLVTGNWTPPAGADDPRLNEVPYTRPPGYTWLLAAAYWTLGDDYIAPRVIQMGLGLLTAVLGFLLGRVLLGPRVGLILAAMISVFWLFIHYECELQEPALLSVLGMGLLLALCHWRHRPGLVLAIISGVIIAAFALTRPNVLLFAPLAALWMLWCSWRNGFLGLSVKHAAVFAIAAGLAIAPVTWRNLTVADEFVLISCNGPINFYIGNNRDSDGVSFILPEFRELTGLTNWGWFSYDRVVRGLEGHTGRAMTYSDVSRYFNQRAWAFIRENPGRFAELTLRRALLFWGPAEIANNKVEQYEREHSRVLRWLPNYPLMLALSLVGVGVLILRRPWTATGDLPASSHHGRLRLECLALVGLFILVYFLSFVPFLVASRFRAPLLPVVFLFAAFGLDRMIAMARAAQPQWRTLGVSAASVVILFLVLMQIAAATSEERRDRPRWHVDRGTAYANAARHAEAAEQFQTALEVNPQYVSAYAAWFESAVATDDVPLALSIHQRLLTNRPDRQDVRREMAAQLAGLGQHRLRSDRPAEAVEALRASLITEPQQAETLCNLGVALAQLGNTEEAFEMYRRSVELKPDFSEGWYNLGVSHHRRGENDAAAAAYHKALEFNARNIEALLNLGSIEASRGQFDQARQRFERVLEINPAQTVAKSLLQELDTHQLRP